MEIHDGVRDDLCPSRSMDEMSDEDYNAVLPVVLDTVKAVNFGCYQSILIYDFLKDNVLYYSDIWLNAFSALQQTNPVSFEDMRRDATGIDWDRCVSFRSQVQQFYDTLPPGEIMDYMAVFSCESHCSRMSTRLLHKSIPLRMTRSGKLWLSLILSFPSTGSCNNEFEMVNTKNNEHYLFKGDKMGWVKLPSIYLSDRERLVLIMAAQGHSLQRIADSFYVSVDSVKSCRRKLFAKLGVTNIQEAITKVMNNGYMWQGEKS